MMAGNIRLQIVTPEKSVVDEDAQIVVAPGSMGEFGVLIGHTPFMTTLKLGTLRYNDISGKERCVFISGGFAEALPDKVTVLAESAERRCDIDLERARTAMERAEKRLADEAAKKQEVDYARAKAALQRAIHRIRLSETRHN
jgi:F-type H+-transporting ATPase subunit epsilon